MSARALRSEPLTPEAFAPFGRVLAADAPAERRSINAGWCERVHALSILDVSDAGGRAILSIFRARPRPSPILIAMLERHPLGDQAFMPLQPRPWAIVVAPSGADGAPDLAALRAFSARGDQGAVYAKGVWHHPLLAYGVGAHDFLVADREGPPNEAADANLEEVFFETEACRLPLL